MTGTSRSEGQRGHDSKEDAHLQVLRLLFCDLCEAKEYKLSFRTFEVIGDFALDAIDVLFPFKQPPPPPAPVQRSKPKLPPDGSFLVGHETGTFKPIYALSSELDRHVLIVGATGCGKTTLIARLFTEEVLKWQ